MSTHRSRADAVIKEAFGVSRETRILPLSKRPGWWVHYGPGKVRLTRKKPRGILPQTARQEGTGGTTPDPT